MVDAAFVQTLLGRLAEKDLSAFLASFSSESTTTANRVQLIETALQSPAGPLLRAAIGKWIVERIVPVEALVPETYAKWRGPVQDAMLFVVSHLSAARLAPKILEQAELPPDATPETRLLRLIAKVPGLQKLGQVISRNRRLRPSLRAALAQLEDDIHDVEPEDIRALIQRELGSRLENFAVEIEEAILSEASVSAVVRFTWWNPARRQRERGVFKVLKPYIPACFAEDMDILQQLAEHFGSRHEEYGFAGNALPDTFTKVRRLLEHEVNFLREQVTLEQAYELYRTMNGVRVPRLIQPLCTPVITAISEEHGAKITDAVAHMPVWRRGQVAGQLIEALIAAPLLAAEADAMFHADPHAGNLLYNTETGELIILDWALTEHLSRDQRRHLALLFFMVSLRDRMGVSREVKALCEHPVQRNSQQAKVVQETVAGFLDQLPLTHLPGPVDAMVLLEQLAVKGILFPAPLIMFSKALFTLDAILDEVGGSDALRGFTIASHVAQRWLGNRSVFGSPLGIKDWITVQCSAMLCGGRLSIKLEEAVLGRLLPVSGGSDARSEPNA